MRKIDLSVNNKNEVLEALVKHINELLPNTVRAAHTETATTGKPVETITIRDLQDRTQTHRLHLDGTTLRLSNNCVVLQVDLNDPTSIDQLNEMLLMIYKSPPEFRFMDRIPRTARYK